MKTIFSGISNFFVRLYSIALATICHFLSENKINRNIRMRRKPQWAFSGVMRLAMMSLAVTYTIACSAQAQRAPFLPSQDELNRSFGPEDRVSFLNPPKTYHPGTWFHFIGGNVSKEGITRDLEAVAKAGFSAIHLFHGQFGGVWPGVDPQITAQCQLG